MRDRIGFGSSRRDRSARWTEVEILDDVEAYVVVVTGRSVVPGETNRVRETRCLSAAEVCSATLHGGRLSYVAESALEDAAVTDGNIALALSDLRTAIESAG